MFQQMTYFIAVVEEKNFTKAAERCNISQSAISQQIKTLEMELGFKLLTRVGRSFELTAAGEYFYTHSKEIVSSVQQLVERTSQLANQEQATVRGRLYSKFWLGGIFTSRL